MRPERGFTLVEILISVVVSSLAIMTLYASYDIVEKQYTKIRDVAVVHQGGRNIVEMLKRDIRMAGYTYRDNTGNISFGAISQPIDIVDSGDQCCDEITVEYDYQIPGSPAQRLKIRYWVETFTGALGTRGRLFKQTDVVFPIPIAGPREVMADHIEDLQFVRDQVVSSGSVQNLAKQSTDLVKSSKLLDGNYGCNSGCDAHCENGWKFGAGLNPTEKISATFASPIEIGGIGLYAGAGGEKLSGYVQIKSGGTYTQIKTVNNVGPSPTNAKIQFTQNVATDSLEFVMTAGGGSDNNICVFEFEIYPGGNLSNLVDIFLAVRTRDQYGPAKKYEKKTYRKGNFRINKTDSFRRGEYSTTVLVRNLAL